MWDKGSAHVQVGSEGHVDRCLGVIHGGLGGSGQSLLPEWVVLVPITGWSVRWACCLSEQRCCTEERHQLQSSRLNRGS